MTTPIERLDALVLSLNLVEREMHTTCGAVEGPYNAKRFNKLAKIRETLARMLLDDTDRHRTP